MYFQNIYFSTYSLAYSRDFVQKCVSLKEAA